MTQASPDLIAYADQLEETIRQRGPISALVLASFMPPPPGKVRATDTHPSQIKVLPEDLGPALGYLHREGRIAVRPGPSHGLTNPTTARNLAAWYVLDDPATPEQKDPTATPEPPPGDTQRDERPKRERRRWR